MSIDSLLGYHLAESDEYLAILRCQTWNVWPERVGVECRPFPIHYGPSLVVPARLLVRSYVQRSVPECYFHEETTLGPLVWDGEMHGLHHIRDTVLKAPSDEVQLTARHRHVERGEIDICINFRFDGELPNSLIEALRATASAIMSLTNLQLGDYLTPAAPFQIRKVLSDGDGEVVVKILLAVHDRQILKKKTLGPTLSSIARVLLESTYGEKLRVALELYAAHFTERQTRVRFLLLVIAMESLAKPTLKHQVAIDLLDSWRAELQAKLVGYEATSEAYQSLESLFRELRFRSDDSIGSQIRKLFLNLPSVSSAEASELQKRARRVYDARSMLVHYGHLPVEKLSSLEIEARELLEKLFSSAIEEVRE